MTSDKSYFFVLLYNLYVLVFLAWLWAKYLRNPFIWVKKYTHGQTTFNEWEVVSFNLNDFSLKLTSFSFFPMMRSAFSDLAIWFILLS